MTTVSDLLVEFKEKPGKGHEPPILTLTERNGFVRQADRFKKRLATDDVSNYKVIRRNDIAFNPYLLWAGAIAQNTIVDDGITSPLYPTFRVRDGHDPRYVARLLLTPELLGAYDGIAFGSVPRRRRSSVDDFLKLSLLKVPPLPEQRRIAAILDHADSLRAKRRQVLAHLDSLTQSIFHKVFEEDQGVQEYLGDVATFFGGASLVAGEPFDGQVGGTLLMRVSDMNAPGNEEAIHSTSSWTSAATHRACTAPAGTVVLPKRGASIATNKKRITIRSTALDPNLMGVLPKTSSLSVSYLYAWFKSFDLTSIASGSTVPQLNKQDLAPLRIIVPEVTTQRTFEQQIAGVNLHRDAVLRACIADDALLASLQSRAFRGEL